MRKLPEPIRNEVRLNGRDDLPRVVAIHGFTGSTYECYPLGLALNALGYRVHHLCLAGHGTTLEALRKTSATSWFAQVRNAIHGDDDKVILIGASMGGALAIWASVTFPQRIRAQILLGAALRLTPKNQFGSWLSQFQITHDLPDLVKEDPGGSINDPKARAQNTGYPAIPYQALGEYYRVQRKARAKVIDLKVPTLAFWGRHDETVDNARTMRLFANAKKASIRHVMCPNSAHILGLDYDRDMIASESVHFLKNILSPSHESGISS